MEKQTKLSGLIGLATRAGKICFGTEACFEQIERKKVKLVFLATNASERTKKRIKEKCKEQKVPVEESFSMEQISQATGKTNKVVIGIQDYHFANQMQKIISGGEIIG